MNDQILDRYADLLLNAGVNLQPDQVLFVNAEPIHWDFVVRLTEKAYEMGARYVDANCTDPRVKLARINRGPEGSLDYFPEHIRARYQEYTELGVASIHFRGLADPHVFKDLDQSKNAIHQKAFSNVYKMFREAASAGRIPWTVAALPTDGWAEQITGTADSAVLWDLLKPILRLDQPDPSQSWYDAAGLLNQRAACLNEHAFERLHFAADGTDLTVHLLPKSKWAGGFITLPDGRRFIPNLPTEEVFTSPDYRKTSGRAKITKPVEVLGHEVQGAWFEFTDGLVTDYGAEEGKERLDTFFEIDERARSLGEIALVDGASPIFQSGQIFHSILYDENAACHMALGSSYSDAYEGGPDMSEDELYAAGLNQSILHTDFMIGTSDIDVTGTTADGAEIPILRNGAFVTPFDSFD